MLFVSFTLMMSVSFCNLLVLRKIPGSVHNIHTLTHTHTHTHTPTHTHTITHTSLSHTHTHIREKTMHAPCYQQPGSSKINDSETPKTHITDEDCVSLVAC